MRFSYGRTRFVILFGNKAIKIARVPLLVCFGRALLNLISHKEREKFFKEYGDKLARAIYLYFIKGIVANLNEYTYWLSSHDRRVVPVLKKLLCGFIIIQVRGENISEEEFLKNNPINKKFAEANKPWQLCKISNEVKVLDYGDEETCNLLRQSFTGKLHLMQ